MQLLVGVSVSILYYLLRSAPLPKESTELTKKLHPTLDRPKGRKVAESPKTPYNLITLNLSKANQQQINPS